MKKSLSVTLAALALAGGTAYAIAASDERWEGCERNWQGSEHRMEHKQHRGAGGFMKHLGKELEMTSEQREQVRNLMEQRHDSLQKTRSQLHETRKLLWQLDPGSDSYQADVAQLAQQKGALMGSMVQYHGQLKADIYALLSPEQQQTFKQQIEERFDKKHHREDD
jgi:Spy/CpxP family protein refolding chaperone